MRSGPSRCEAAHGADTDEVLAEAGFNAERRLELRARGII
jgi:crotonobetainyl-CoA:carnitine CoA-transferase CaiB-like acyl-CoA transferase